MYKGGHSKTYVVFRGRKPDIYATWVECHAQVNTFKGSSYEAFQIPEEANNAWINYCQSGYNHNHSTKDEGANSSYLQRDNAEDDGDKHYVKHGPDDFVIEYNMQKLLYQICACHRIQAPRYTLHSKTTIAGQQYFKYYASLPTNAISAPTVSMGRFAKTEDLAREDVAVLLLHRLLASNGSKIRDYNYYNVEILEAQTQKLTSQNFELQMEKSMLLEELHMLRGGPKPF